MVPATMIHLTVNPTDMATQRHMELPQPAWHPHRRARRIAESGVAVRPRALGSRPARIPHSGTARRQRLVPAVRVASEPVSGRGHPGAGVWRDGVATGGSCRGLARPSTLEGWRPSRSCLRTSRARRCCWGVWETAATPRYLPTITRSSGRAWPPTAARRWTPRETRSSPCSPHRRLAWRRSWRCSRLCRPMGGQPGSTSGCGWVSTPARLRERPPVWSASMSTAPPGWRRSHTEARSCSPRRRRRWCATRCRRARRSRTWVCTG